MKPRILCVDDEPHVLDGLELQLGRTYRVSLARSGAQALQMLQENPDYAAVVSDMRMPMMDGAALLRQVRATYPDVTRVLLTGHAEIESAISAVNDGGVFRFLCKPCRPPVLLDAVAAAVEQNRLVRSERELLELTLQGSVRTLVDVLALTRPVSFGRAARVATLVAALALELSLQRRWEVELAARLCTLGHVSLPAELAEREASGRPLSREEDEAIGRAAQITEQLLANIPRLEGVRAILAGAAAAARPSEPTAVAVLRASVDFDLLESQGTERIVALEILRGRGAYSATVLDTLDRLRGSGAPRRVVKELALGGLIEGMEFAEDVRLQNGALLLARGNQVTASFLERCRNYKGTIRTPVRVYG